MAIIISKVYENYTPKENIIADIKDMWSWSKVEEDTEKQSVKFHVNDNTYFEVYEPENYANRPQNAMSPIIELVFKGVTVHKAGGGLPSTGWKASIHIVKTNKATLIQFAMVSGTEVPLNALTWIISTSTNHSTGDKEAVVAYQTTPSTLANMDHNCVAVLSDDIPADNIITTRFQGTLKHNKTILLPLNCDASRYVMDDVYLLYKLQVSELYCGECTLNGRKYYMHNWILTPDD